MHGHNMNSVWTMISILFEICYVTPHFGVKRTLGSKSRNWPQSALICYISTHFGFQRSKGVIWVLLKYRELTYFRSATLKYLRWISRWRSILWWCLSDKSFINFTTWNIKKLCSQNYGGIKVTFVVFFN
jgi:hypothetical protein